MLAWHRSPFQMESRPLFANASHKKGIKSKASDPTVKRRTLHLVSSIKSRKDLRKNARKKTKEAIQKTHRHCKDRSGKTLRWEEDEGTRDAHALQWSSLRSVLHIFPLCRHLFRNQ
jgi:hypothetical protein